MSYNFVPPPQAPRIAQAQDLMPGQTCMRIADGKHYVITRNTTAYDVGMAQIAPENPELNTDYNISVQPSDPVIRTEIYGNVTFPAE